MSGAKREPTGSQNWREPASPTAGMCISEGPDRGCHGLVRCRQRLQCDDPFLMLDSLRAPFSQVNNGLRDMFPARAGSALTEQRFVIVWRRYWTLVQLRIASVPGKQSLGHVKDTGR